jgi:stringent starvation protein B
MSDSKMNEKKTKLLACLEKGLSQIHLDPRRAGVIAPDHLKQSHLLVLNLSYNFDPPDLSLSDWGIRETLSFSGSRFTVGVPWSAVFAVASLKSQDLFMYPDDMPHELATSAAERVNTEKMKTGPKIVPATPASILREVIEVETTPEEKIEPTPPKRGHLRVVK